MENAIFCAYAGKGEKCIPENTYRTLRKYARKCRIFPYMGNYGSEKSRILTCLKQWRQHMR